MFNVECVVNVCPRRRSELIDSAWVVIVPGQKLKKHNDNPRIYLNKTAGAIVPTTVDARY